MPSYVFDMETLPSHTLFCAKNVDTGEWFDLWRHEPDAPMRLMKFMIQNDSTYIGFNNISFDNTIVAAFCAGRSEVEIKRIADDLIGNRLPHWMAMRKYGLRQISFDFVDLIEVAPSFVGLKAYGARMHMKTLQDMPLAHDQALPEGKEDELLGYCHNDVDTTEELLKRLDGQLMLRVEMSRQYGVDMRSKSDSQMAEQAYIKTLGLDHKQNVIPKSVTYTPPAFLKFKDAALQELLYKVSQHTFGVNPETGHVHLPDFLGKDQIKFNAGIYQMGIGGIHSQHDTSVCHVAGEDIICDIDAASFYPSIILQCGYVPKELGQPFIDEYRRIYERRLAAKASGDKVTNETLKISLNGTFGKLMSRWSPLYSPDLGLAVTLTGQFTLLMLIEWLEHLGAVTLSANTDGLAMSYGWEMKGQVEQIVSRFSALSGYEFEYTPYRLIAIKDVNNYVAVKTDRKLKAKGIYAPISLSKNATAQVCADAVGQWLAHGTPLLETLKSAGFTGFISARNVTGGAVCGGELVTKRIDDGFEYHDVPERVVGGEYLGKVVRWYMSTEKDLPPLRYVKNGNKVPKTDGAKACMVLPETVPEDLDIMWYYREALKIAKVLGCEQYLTPEEREMISVKPKRKKNGK